MVTKNDLLSGQTTQPIWLFIASKILVFGDEMLPIDFTQFTYLAQGSGPFLEGEFGSNFTRPEIIGPLDPFPIAVADGTEYLLGYCTGLCDRGLVSGSYHDRRWA